MRIADQRRCEARRRRVVVAGRMSAETVVSFGSLRIWRVRSWQKDYPNGFLRFKRLLQGRSYDAKLTASNRNAGPRRQLGMHLSGGERRR